MRNSHLVRNVQHRTRTAHGAGDLLGRDGGFDLVAFLGITAPELDERSESASRLRLPLDATDLTHQAMVIVSGYSSKPKHSISTSVAGGACSYGATTSVTVT